MLFFFFFSGGQKLLFRTEEENTEQEKTIRQIDIPTSSLPSSCTAEGDEEVLCVKVGGELKTIVNILLLPAFILHLMTLLACGHVFL